MDADPVSQGGGDGSEALKARLARWLWVVDEKPLAGWPFASPGLRAEYLADAARRT